VFIACETFVCSVGRAVVELTVREMRVEEVLAGEKNAEMQVGEVRKGFEDVREDILIRERGWVCGAVIIFFTWWNIIELMNLRLTARSAACENMSGMGECTMQLALSWKQFQQQLTSKRSVQLKERAVSPGKALASKLRSAASIRGTDVRVKEVRLIKG
jgi:hypothetical protein